MDSIRNWFIPDRAFIVIKKMNISNNSVNRLSDLMTATMLWMDDNVDDDEDDVDA